MPNVETSQFDTSLNSFTGQFPVAVPPAAATPPAAPADLTALDRIEETLDRIEQLSDLLTVEEDYEFPPLNYKLPEKFKLSVVIPVYNEEASLYQILGRVAAMPLPKEIIIVDDYSTDGTRQLLRPLEELRDVQIIYKPQNEGKGAALRTGFKRVTGDVVVIQDADLEYDPRDIPRLIEPILDGAADVVYGSRFLSDEKQDPSWLHRFGNGMLTRASNLTTGLRLTDMETCYKAFRSGVLRAVDVRQNRFGFEPEITAKLARKRCRFHEIPIRYNPRSYEKGKKIGVKDGFNALYCIARYAMAD